MASDPEEEGGARRLFKAHHQQRQQNTLADLAKLPPELRVMVWHHIIPKDINDMDLAEEHSHSLAILRASSTLYDEITAELYPRMFCEISVGPGGARVMNPPYREEGGSDNFIPRLSL